MSVQGLSKVCLTNKGYFLVTGVPSPLGVWGTKVPVFGGTHPVWLGGILSAAAGRFGGGIEFSGKVVCQSTG